jgi:hypothetical protein
MASLYFFAAKPPSYSGVGCCKNKTICQITRIASLSRVVSMYIKIQNNDSLTEVTLGDSLLVCVRRGHYNQILIILVCPSCNSLRHFVLLLHERMDETSPEG